MAGEMAEELRRLIVDGKVDEATKLITDAGNSFPVNSFIGNPGRSRGLFEEPTALTLAAKHGQAECVKKILELGNDMYSIGVGVDDAFLIPCDYFGALVLAASYCHFDIVHLLTKFRLCEAPGVVDDYLDLVKAVEDADFQRIKTLLESVENRVVFLKGWRGHNIMNMCLLQGCSSSCLQEMIDFGIGVNGWDYNGLTPLMCAIIRRNVDCVQFLLEKGADPYEIHMLQRSSFRDDGSVLYMDEAGEEIKSLEPGHLLESRRQCRFDYFGATALMYAAVMGNIPILKTMLKVAPEDVKDWGRFRCHSGIGLLSIACHYANSEAVSSILQLEDAINGFNIEELGNAIFDDNTELVKTLMSSNIDWEDWYYPDVIGEPVVKNKPRCLEIVLDSIGKKKNVFTLDRGQNLFNAIEKNYSECVNVFIKQPEFSVDMKCSYLSVKSCTSFAFSCMNGRLELAKIFLEMGANVNGGDKEGRTAAMYAARENRVECLEFLMDIKADFDAVDNFGGTVFSAALIGDGSCLEFLLKNGCILDENGLKRVHRQSIKVFGLEKWDQFWSGHKGIGAKNFINLIEHKLFHWEWCSMVNKNTMYLIVFAAVTSGISPGKLTYNGQQISPFTYAVLVKDMITVRYLLANMYLLPDDYRAVLSLLASNATTEFGATSNLVHLMELLTLQPLSLQTWSIWSIWERIVSLSEEPGVFDTLPLPVGTKDLLKSKKKFSQLCPRHWKRLGAQRNQKIDAYFDDIIEHGQILVNPTRKICKKPCCSCEGQGLALEEFDDIDEELDNLLDREDDL